MKGDNPPPRFLVDRMLIRLGRWLRAAGYDAAFDEHRASDRALLERAVAEGRLLLTCDRKLLEFRAAPGRVLILPGGGVFPAAEALSARLAVDWLHRPFSRCLLCNRLLEAADAAAGAMAPRGAQGPFKHCPSCGKLYWQGGHAARMRAQLARWNAGRFD